MIVKIAPIGKRVVEVALVEGATVRDAFTASEYEVPSNVTLKIGDSTVSLDSPVHAGDIIEVYSNLKNG